MSDFAQQFQNNVNRRLAEPMNYQNFGFPNAQLATNPVGFYGQQQATNTYMDFNQNNRSYNRGGAKKKNFNPVYQKVVELTSKGQQALAEINQIFGNRKYGVAPYGEFIVAKAPYNIELVSLFRNLKGVFCKVAKCWVFKSEERNTVESALNATFAKPQANSYQNNVNNMQQYQMPQQIPQQMQFNTTNQSQMSNMQNMQNMQMPSVPSVSLNDLMQAVAAFSHDPSINTLQVGSCILLKKDLNDPFTQRALQNKGLYISDLGAWIFGNNA